MNDFANTPATAPHFDATGNRRGTRRRRAGVIATTAIAIALAGTGAALATVGTASHTTERTSTTTTMTTTKGNVKGNVTTVPYAKPFDLQGVNLAGAEEALAQAGLTVGTVTHGVVDNCKPGSVIAVSPLAPTVLHAGDKVDLGLCG
ncbi:PASTA domain-containing protein [Streptomyces sp. NPDC050538]|uniref:PASTA domain-containing protein n=1 Tax=Streptomyces sp. NPDC050538 TaxID=3365627 RepID=UPI0037900736